MVVGGQEWIRSMAAVFVSCLRTSAHLKRQWQVSQLQLLVTREWQRCTVPCPRYPLPSSHSSATDDPSSLAQTWK